jgi:hypothetical protein
MSAKIGRNDPCPCSSGRKYKHCCGGAAATRDTEEKRHTGAVERALDWLASRHRSAAGVAMEAMLFGGLTDEERATLETQDDETWQQIHLNANEWLLAEAAIDVHGKPTRVVDLLLGPGGPLFTVEQRQWIAQLSERPLRLYDVTDVVPGRQMTLCDSLNTEAPPIVVMERAGSQESLVGSQVGFRIMEVGAHREISGAAYPFSLLAGPQVIDAMRRAVRKRGRRADRSAELSSIIRRHWLAQYFAGAPIPTIVDAITGEPLLLVTDHYRVKDWKALQQALTAEPGVERDRATGWARLETKSDEQTRPIVSINPEKGADRISVFYRTQGYADRGRPWFEALARDAVQFLSRELSDPKGALANAPITQRQKPDQRAPDLPPDVMAEIIEKAIRQSYTNWPDEPIPALGGKTPRQAMRTAAGVERVKGLLRGYEASETQQARREGRRAISYAFLWKALGIAPM